MKKIGCYTASKKFISIIVVLALVLTLVPMAALAEGEEQEPVQQAACGHEACDAHGCTSAANAMDGVGAAAGLGGCKEITAPLDKEVEGEPPAQGQSADIIDVIEVEGEITGDPEAPDESKIAGDPDTLQGGTLLTQKEASAEKPAETLFTQSEIIPMADGDGGIYQAFPYAVKTTAMADTSILLVAVPSMVVGTLNEYKWQEDGGDIPSSDSEYLWVTAADAGKAYTAYYNTQEQSGTWVRIGEPKTLVAADFTGVNAFSNVLNMSVTFDDRQVEPDAAVDGKIHLKLTPGIDTNFDGYFTLSAKLVDVNSINPEIPLVTGQSLTTKNANNFNDVSFSLPSGISTKGSYKMEVSLSFQHSDSGTALAPLDMTGITQPTAVLEVDNFADMPDNELRRFFNVDRGRTSDENKFDLIPIDYLNGLMGTVHLGLFDVKDITGMEHLTGISTLSLGTGLQGRGGGVTGIAPLEFLPQLEELDLGEHKISDLSPISAFANLESLTLGKNPVANVAQITALVNNNSLTHFSMDGVKADAALLAALTAKTGLTSIHLQNAGVSDISFLSQLTNLTSIWMTGNNIADISVLSGLTSLTDVRLSDNNISDISALAPIVSGLNQLYLANNKITDVSPITSYTGTLSADGQDGGTLTEQLAEWGELSITNPIGTVQNAKLSIDNISDNGTYNSDSNTVSWTGLREPPPSQIVGGSAAAGAIGTAGMQTMATKTVTFRYTFSFNGQLIENTLSGTVTVPYYVQYAILATAGEGGTVSPLGTTMLREGSNQEYVITPSAGYTVHDIAVNGQSVGAKTGHTFEDVQADHTIHVTFAQDTGSGYTITSSAGDGGTITPLGNTNVAAGGSQEYLMVANAGYRIKDVLVDGQSVGTSGYYRFTDVQSNHTIHVDFEPGVSYTITSTTGAGGTISPLGKLSVNAGGSPGYTMTPDSGYVVADVLVDGASVGARTNYSFENVAANHTIHVTFKTATAATTTSPKTDDTSNLSLYITLVMIAGVSIAGVVAYRGRKTQR